jgi:ribose transport system ATP-binding protein
MMTAMADSQPFLQMQDIDKRFTGVGALKKARFELRRGEIHALMGENGAGKSTLMKVLAGICSPDEGTVLLNGNPIRFHNPKDAQGAGISIVHQELNLMNHLTAAQNIFIGRESKGFFLNDSTINEKVQKIFDNLKLYVQPTEKVGTMTIGKQQMIEIAKAISFDSSVLILDEPTTALTETEIKELFDIVRGLRQKGTAIVYISHRMNEIMEIADRITVMRDGETVATLNTKETCMDEIIQAMIGRAIYEKPKTDSAVKPDAPVVLEVKGLCSHKVKNVSFHLHKGEILGLAGLMGAGRTETVRMIFGADPLQSGKILKNGRPLVVRTPKDAVAAGIGYLSEDRKHFGLAMGLSVEDNAVLPSLEYFSSRGFVKRKETVLAATQYVDQLNIKTPSIWQLVRYLSGGNQQKVIIAKWLLRNCDILIFDEPTRGIDVGAKSEIYKLMNELTAEGKSIIMISSEMQEMLRMSDRVACMCEGHLTKIIPIQDATQELIMKNITSHNNP